MLDRPAPIAKAPRRSKAEPKPVQRIHVLNGRVLLELRPRRGERIGTFHRRATQTGACAGMRTIVAERVNGDLVPILKKDYHRRIGVKIELVLISAPGGGGGGGGSAGAAGLIGMLALVAFAPVAAGAIAGAAFGGSGASVISALIIGGGSILLSHFMGAKKGAKSAIPEYSVNIRSNESRSQQPIPVPYGRLKRFPDLAASQWSSFQGTAQVFHGLYSLGCGSHELEEIGIGDTTVWTAAGGFVPGYAGVMAIQQVEPGQDCTLFPIDVYSSPSVSGQELPDPYGTTYSDGTQNTGANGEVAGVQVVGPFTVNPSGTQTNHIEIDLVAPSGLYYTNTKGNTKPVSVNVKFEIQPIDDQGHPIGNGAWQDVLEFPIIAESKQAVRLTLPIDVPPGRFNCRLSRMNAMRQDGGVDTMTWVGLRSFLIGPNAVPYASRLAIQLVADRLLSLASQSQIYVIATRKIYVYDTGAAVLQPSRNPIWAALDVYNNPDYGGNLPLNDVDLLTLQTLAAGANARNECFDNLFTAQTSVYDAISTCLRVMMTSPTFFFNKFSAVRDQVRDIPKMLFTDAEIVNGSVEITYTLKDVNTSDGVILEYTDNVTWLSEEVTSRENGVVLLQPTRIQIPGVTNRDQATILARKMAADNEYRRTTLSFEIENEGMSLERGDLITVQSELPMSWGALRYLMSADTAQGVLELNVDCVWNDADVHYLRIRKANGSIFGPIVCVRGSSDSEVVLSQQSRAAVEQTQGSLAAAIARTDTQGPVTVQFSPSTQQPFNGLVTTIEAGSDEGLFKITVVNDAPEVYLIDGQAVEPLPVLNSVVLPAAPANLFKNVKARLYQEGTSIALDAVWDPDPSSAKYQGRITYDGSNWFNVFEGPVPHIYVTGLSPNNLTLEFRGVNADGLVGAWNSVDLVSPALILNPANLGYGIDFDDLLPSLYANTTFQPVEALEQLFDANLQSLAAAKLQHISLVQEVAGAKASVDELSYALATATEAIAGRVLTFNASIASNAAAIRQESQARATAVDAVASTVTTLTATVQLNNNTLTASITQEAQARATADSATATVITTLTSTVNSNTASITQEAQTRATADSAMATTISNLTATVGSNTAAITNEQQARATQDSAIAASVTSLSTTVGGNSASISTLQASVNGVLVQYGVVGTINGQTGGFIFQGVQRLDGSAYFATYFSGDLIVEGSIYARNIANGAISAFAATGGAVSGSTEGNAGQTIGVTLSLDQPANILVVFSVQCYNRGTTGVTNVTGVINADGNQSFNDNIYQYAGGTNSGMQTCQTIISLGAGTHTIRAGVSVSTSSDAGGVRNGYLTATAFKR